MWTERNFMLNFSMSKPDKQLRVLNHNQATKPER